MDEQKYTVKSTRYIDFPDGRIVMVANIVRKSDNEEAHALYFKSKKGNITDVGLSVEAFKALRQLMIDPNSGNAGTNLAVLDNKEAVIEWRLVNNGFAPVKTGDGIYQGDY